jgi:hypothetical protein
LIPNHSCPHSANRDRFDRLDGMRKNWGVSHNGFASADRSLVVVLGMHRSGTSALTEVLGGMGRRLSPAEHLATDHPGNERGHFEDRRMVEVNDWILRRHGATWDDPWPMARAQPDRDELERVCAMWHTLNEEKCGLIKDPRLCLTLPWWQAAWGSDVRVTYVMIVRHPSQVAESLQARDGLPPLIGELMWLEYVTRTLQHTRGSHTPLVRHSDLMERPERTVRRLAEDLEVSIDVRGPSAAPWEAIDKRLLHHSDQPLPQLHAVRSMYESLVTDDTGHVTDEPTSRSGADLAAVAHLLSTSHRQLTQLAEKSDAPPQTEAGLERRRTLRERYLLRR